MSVSAHISALLSDPYTQPVPRSAVVAERRQIGLEAR
jgi:hypothetical protein